MAMRPVSVLTLCLLILLFAGALAMGSCNNQTVFFPKTMAKGKSKILKIIVHIHIHIVCSLAS